MIDKLKSRKLWAAVVGAALSAFGTQLGLSPDAVTHIVQVVVGYIIGQGIVDAAAAHKPTE